MFKSLKRLFGGDSNENTNSSSEPSDAQTEARTEDAATDEQGAAPQSPPPSVDLSTLPIDPEAIRLEALFAHAMHETRKREEFIEALLKSQLLVLGHSTPGEDGSHNVQLATQTAGSEPIALAFTSIQALVMAGGTPDQAHLKIPAQDLVRMIRGQLGFVLNPGSRVGKVFTRTEVLQLAGESGDEPGADGEMQISVGQPQQYPSGMREALASAIEATPLITSIHTGLMTAGDQPPVFLAVITTATALEREEFLKLINTMGEKVGPSLAGQSINFAPMEPAFEGLVAQGALVDVTAPLA